MSNNQFTFAGKERMATYIAMAIGALSILIGWFTDSTPHHSQTWTNILHDTVFFVGIGFISLFIYSASTTAYGGWWVGFKRIWEAMFGYMMYGGPLFFVLIIGGLWFGWHHLYHWAEPGVAETDELIKHKSGFLNKTSITLFTTVILFIWVFFATKLRSLSLLQDNNADLSIYVSVKKWAAAFLPLGGFSSAFAIWLWLMSIDPHWFSTMYAWNCTASFLVSAMALTLLIIIYLQRQGYMLHITKEHQHDLGKYLFGFSVFWTYLWFSQFMLIWYCNNGEETTYFKTRMDSFTAVFWLNLLINFVAPFFILIRNTAKRQTGIIVFMACLLLFGHWLDFFQMIKPAVWASNMAGHGAAEHAGAVAEHGAATAEHAASTFMLGFNFPGPVELGTFIGFLGFFVFIVFRGLAAAPLLAKNDPYYEESVHHHVM